WCVSQPKGISRMLISLLDSDEITPQLTSTYKQPSPPHTPHPTPHTPHPTHTHSKMENSSFCPKTLRLARSFPEHTTRRPPHRLRTRSLDRQQPPKPIPRRKNSSVDHPAQPPGFHSHIPIEHTLLSVLPSARKASVDAGSPPTASGSRLSTASSAASPQSTLATSVHSAADPPRPRYPAPPAPPLRFRCQTAPPRAR
ncbi:hypothetical protein PTTG_25445, partial [Puccinia triticina 1-1 BBBD Race 1]